MTKVVAKVVSHPRASSCLGVMEKNAIYAAHISNPWKEGMRDWAENGMLTYRAMKAGWKKMEMGFKTRGKCGVARNSP